MSIQPAPELELSEEFLRAVARMGEKGKMKLSKAMKVSPKSLNEIIEKAESEGFVQTYEVETKGRPRTAIRLTDKGEQAITRLTGREGGLRSISKTWVTKWRFLFRAGGGSSRT